MRPLFFLFLSVLLFAGTHQGIAQNYHEQDSLLYRWMMNMDQDVKISVEKQQNIEQDSMDKVMMVRKTKYWHYPGTVKVFILHGKRVFMTDNRINTYRSSDCDTCPTPHDSAWIAEQLKRYKEKKK